MAIRQRNDTIKARAKAKFPPAFELFSRLSGFKLMLLFSRVSKHRMASLETRFREVQRRKASRYKARLLSLVLAF